MALCKDWWRYPLVLEISLAEVLKSVTVHVGHVGLK